MRIRPEMIGALIPFVAFLGLWEAVSRANRNVEFLAGRPTRIATLLIHDLVNSNLFYDLGLTISCAIIGLSIGAGFGFLVGVIVGTSRALDHAVSPFVNLLTVIPLFAAGPLIVLVAGQGVGSKIVLSSLTVSFFAVGLTYQHAKLTPNHLMEVVLIHAGKRTAVIRHVQAPYAALRLATNARLLFGVAVTGVIIGEFLGASMGVGRYIIVAEGLFDVNRIWVGIILLTLSSIAIGLGFTRLEMFARRHLGRE